VCTVIMKTSKEVGVFKISRNKILYKYKEESSGLLHCTFISCKRNVLINVTSIVSKTAATLGATDL